MKTTIAIILLIISAGSRGQVKELRTAGTIQDSLIKVRLIELAIANPALKEADAFVGSAQYQVKRAKSSWLNSIVVSGNINEFVINNTTINGVPATTLFPKYNFGVNIPMGIFGRQETNIAKENLKIYEAQKQEKVLAIKKEVLIRYENYKEKKELLDFQKQLTDAQYRIYQQRQREYANREIIKLEDVNKEYDQWIQQRSTQRTKERDLKIAEIELEEIIGMPLNEALGSLLVK